jgi:DnaJ-class molecular chaperone
MAKCNRCGGKGTIPCPQCKGTGRKSDMFSNWECGHCQGTGEVICPVCNGKGYTG